MKSGYQVFPAERTCYVWLKGLIEGADLIRAAQALYADPAVEPDFNVLWDASAIDELVLDIEGFTGMKDALQRLRPLAGGKGAIVAKRDIVRIAAEYFRVVLTTPTREVRVFRSTDEALAWFEVALKIPAIGSSSAKPSTSSR